MIGKMLRRIAEAFDDSRFIIRLAEGRAEVTKGKVPAGFLADIADFVKTTGQSSGTLRGKRQADYMRLEISRDIPAAYHQRLRNIWHIHEPSFRTVA